jgi:hypothetical protein
MLKFKKLIIMVIVVMLILFLTSIFTSKENVYGTYYGEGDFGSIKIIVKEDNDVINYHFNFTDEYVKQLLETKIYYLQFVANKEFNIYSDTSLYTKENELLYRGVFRGRITKPFALLNLRVNSHIESIKLKKLISE